MKTTRAILKIAAVAGLLLLLVGVACLVFCRPRFHVERGVNISQKIPGEQPSATDYAITMILSVVAS